MREIALDTETTGFTSDDRVCSLGLIEMEDAKPTGTTALLFFNPGKPSTEGALATHGLTEEFLKGKKPFAEHAERIARFLEGAVIVAHNAPFDVRMLDAEFERAGLPFRLSAGEVRDTLPMARKKFPRQPNDLRSVAVRLGIDVETERQHGARYDARLASLIYPLLIERQQTIDLLPVEPESVAGDTDPDDRPIPRTFVSRLQPGDLERHAELIKTIPNAIWGQYVEQAPSKRPRGKRGERRADGSDRAPQAE